MSSFRKPFIKDETRYTYTDYCTWEDDDRWELIDGVPYLMAAPNISHQSISGNIFLSIGNFLRGKKCKILYAPTDVRLNADTKDNTVVQPDLLVVCDKSKLDGKSVVGAPDMVVEILSPSSASHDMIRKYNLYMKTGVREYWIVDPVLETVLVNILKDGAYTRKDYEKTDTVQVGVLEGCEVVLSEVFEEE